ncbi:Linear gramicidin synthase subunit D [Legionella massiliensis]|uniref:Linear gramicidin synthase subunit D n=1 Tax=Legionella massiliensis TaxID=1034943 RepID=A0A078KV38_9GAMM|nr:non-ribosomal peptide synthetase [Legionella massiliensis]CDZ76857.1 Linear gramicidin synthase subunit D [Legionella massiliensis]CEE12595.1 Linear gramicidin synthase subunit D [Legionella massiliensis]
MIIETQAMLMQQWFQQQVHENPNKIALYCEQESLSYGELDQLSDRLASYLSQLKIPAGAPIGICTERHFNMVVGILGIMKAGSPYVPIDPNFPSERINYILQDSRCAFLLSQDSLSAHLKSTIQDSACDILAIEKTLIAKGQKYPVNNEASDPLAYIIYTSGSTGQPKGVQVSHSSVINIIKEMARVFRLSSNDSHLMVIPLCFDVSVSDIFIPLCLGASLVIATETETKNSHKLIKLINQHKVSFMQATPATWRLLLDADWKGASSLKALTGGEALSLQLAKDLACRVRELWNVYGPAEATVWASYARINPDCQKITIGLPFNGVAIYVLDDEGQLQAPGLAGELGIAGKGLAQGYLNRDELNRDKFIKLELPNGERIRVYRTGDRCRQLDNGEFEFLSRCDNQVKVRGIRIEPGEIEYHLLQFYKIKQAVVVAKPVLSEDNDLIAYIVPHDKAKELSSTEILSFLRLSLPEYLIPNFIVELHEIPLTDNNKLNRKALPEPLTNHLRNHSDYVAPISLTEQRLAKIWTKAFKFRHQDISIHYSFHDIGGHSLIALSILNQIESIFGLSLTIDLFYKHSTIEALADFIDSSLEGSQLNPAELSSEQTSSFKELDNKQIAASLSLEQHGIWLFEALFPNHAAYNISTIFHLKGHLNIAALNLAVNEVIKRHSILRTIFIHDGEEPKQVLLTEQDFELAIIRPDPNGIIDFSIAYEFLKNQAEQPIELEKWPLFKLRLYPLNEREYLFLICIHHLIIDGCSLAVFLNEMSFFYKLHCLKYETTVLEFPTQYLSYSQRQKEQLLAFYQSPKYDLEKNYWLNQLANLIPVDFPTDYPRPSELSFNSKLMQLTLPNELAETMKEIVCKTKTSQYAFLLSILGVLLSRYCVQNDLVIGCPNSISQQESSENRIGPVGGLFVLRMDLSQNVSFIDLLKTNTRTVNDALTHYQLPFERLIDLLKLAMDRSRHPAVQILLIELADNFGTFFLDNISIQSYPLHLGSAGYDLVFFYQLSHSGLHLIIEYNSDLFNSETIEMFLQHFNNLLKNALKNPQCGIYDLSLFDMGASPLSCQQKETQNLDQQSIPELFAAIATQFAAKIAVKDQGRQLSYCELDKQSNQLANFLIAQKLRPQTLIAVCMERSVDAIISILAILKANCVYLPIDSEYPEARITQILNHSQTPFMLTQNTHFLRMKALSALCLHPLHLVSIDEIQFDRFSDQQTLVGNNNSDLAYIIYTSGTTGIPKGIALEHKTISNLAQWQMKNPWFAQIEKVTQFASLGFDVSVQEIFYTLLSARELAVIPNCMKYSMNNFLSYISREQINQIFLPTAILCYFAKEGLLFDYSLDALKEIIVAGEKLIVDDQIREFFIKYKHIRLTNQYGPSETHVVSAHTLSEDPLSWNYNPPIGQAIDNVDLHVLSKELRPLPTGIIGELYIGGCSLAREYINQPDLTQEKMIANPFVMGEKLYKSGDLVKRLANGDLLYIGREDNQVKIRGFRVELGEIEAVLLRHPEVKNCVVLVDEQSRSKLLAYIEPFDYQNHPDTQAILQWLKTQLPKYMVPSQLFFIADFPFTLNGKINKTALLANHHYMPVDEQIHVHPRTANEKKLVDIIVNVLELDEVSTHKNIFDLGATSLNIIKILIEIKDKFAIDLPAAQLFEPISIRELSEVIANCCPLSSQRIQKVSLV